MRTFVRLRKKRKRRSGLKRLALLLSILLATVDLTDAVGRTVEVFDHLVVHLATMTFLM